MDPVVLNCSRNPIRGHYKNLTFNFDQIRTSLPNDIKLSGV